MGRSKLSGQQRAALRQASRDGVQEVFARFGPYFRRYFHNGRWIGTTNRYRSNSIDRLRHDTKQGNCIHSKHLLQYIAVSGPLHCMDGWSYLGRANHSLARGDASTARHLAYYAELRGAMSLLASEGVGIFHNRHFILDASGVCKDLPPGPNGRHHHTHQITWLALEHWATLNRSTDLLADIISPNNIPLQEWLDGFRAADFRPMGMRLLNSWGLDLQRLSKDRDSRNEASYRPTHLVSQDSVDALSCSRYLQSLWALCQPQGDSSFEVLDRHLLRLTLEPLYQTTSEQDARASGQAYETRVQAMLSFVGLDGPTRGKWEDFLTWRSEPTLPQPFDEASGTLQVTDPRHHLQVISRAALLLRVATGACNRLVRDTGSDREELAFWWRPLGESMGLWEPTFEPQLMTDLWADVEQALDDMSVWQAANGAKQPSFASWWRDRAYSISVLGSCERIALWGLGL